MAGPGSGILSQICAKDETTYGVAPSLTSGAVFYAVKGGGSLKGKKTTVEGEGLYSGALHGKASRRAVVEWSADGAIPMELPARSLNPWLARMLGSYGQAPAALTQDGVTGAYKAIHAPGPLQGHSFVVQKGIPAVDGSVEPFTYTGCKVSDWELSFDRAQIADLTLTIAARNELAGAGNSDPLNGSVPGLAAYTEPLGGVFTFVQASIFTGGTPSTTAGVTTVSGATLAGNIKSGSVKYAIPLDLERFFAGGAGFHDEPIDNALRQLTGQLVIEWLSTEAMYNAYLADSATTVEYRFTGPPIGSGSDHSMLSLLVPHINIDGDPPDVPGPQVVTQTITWTGLDDDANNPLQATYWTLDSA